MKSWQEAIAEARDGRPDALARKIAADSIPIELRPAIASLIAEPVPRRLKKGPPGISPADQALIRGIYRALTDPDANGVVRMKKGAARELICEMLPGIGADPVRDVTLRRGAYSDGGRGK